MWEDPPSPPQRMKFCRFQRLKELHYNFWNSSDAEAHLPFFLEDNK